MKLCDGSSPLRRLVRSRPCRWHRRKCAVRVDARLLVHRTSVVRRTSVPRLPQDILPRRLRDSMAAFPAGGFVPVEALFPRIPHLCARRRHALGPRAAVVLVLSTAPGTLAPFGALLHSLAGALY